MIHTSPLRFSSRALVILLVVIASSVQAQQTGGIILRWTAPGDDGYVGTAAGYEIKYQAITKGPLDTQSEWQLATSVPNVPFPSRAKSIDSALVLGLTPGAAYYFALRAFDKAGNYSELSNSPLVVAVSTNCCTGLVGDVNGMGGDEPTISDVAMLIDHVFGSGRPLWCTAEADLNQSGGVAPEQGPNGDITIADIAILIDYLFVTGRPLAHCL